MFRGDSQRRPRCNCGSEDLHIDGCEGTVGDGAADSASKGESGVEGKARQLLRLGGLEVLLESIKLHRAGGSWRGLRSHCVWSMEEE